MEGFVKTYRFKEGKVIGEYVLLSDYDKVVDELESSKSYITQLKHDAKEMEEKIAKLKSELEEKVDFETDRLVKLPFNQLETANMLINATYKAEIPFLERKVDRNVYDIDDLEQIAEHLLVYCKHNKESEE